MVRSGVGLMAVVLVAVLCAPAAVGTEAMQVRVEVSASTQVGHPFDVVIHATGLHDVRAAEMSIAADMGAATVTDAHTQDADDRLALGPAVSAEGVALGFLTCAPTVCGERLASSDGAASDPSELGRLAITPERTGRFDLRVGPVTLVTSDRVVHLDVEESEHSVEVVPGAGGSSKEHVDATTHPRIRDDDRDPATTGVGALEAADRSGSARPRRLALRPALALPALDHTAIRAAASTFDRAESEQPELAGIAAAADITDDRDLTQADLLTAELAWTSAREMSLTGTVAGEVDADVVPDGHLDVADLQVVADAAQPDVDATMANARRRALLVVTSTEDGHDTDKGDGTCTDATGGCTLRAAIQEANARSGADAIHFRIPGDGVHTIRTGQALPPLQGSVHIDGFTQPGAAPGTVREGTNGAPKPTIKIQVRGQGPSYDGFRITSGNNRISGIAVFDHRVEVRAHAVSSGSIQGMILGTDARSTIRQSAPVPGDAGLAIRSLLGNLYVESSVFSGNGDAGLSIRSARPAEWRPTGVSISSSTFGLRTDATDSVPNLGAGLEAVGRGSSIRLFTSTLSGNAGAGVSLRRTYANIRRVMIGVDPGGSWRPWTGNGGPGLYVGAAARAGLQRSTLTGNGGAGVELNAAAPVTAVRNEIGSEGAPSVLADLCPGNGARAGVVITNGSAMGSSWTANTLCGTEVGYWVRGNNDNDGHRFGGRERNRTRPPVTRFRQIETPIEVAGRAVGSPPGEDGPNGGIRPPTDDWDDGFWVASCDGCVYHRYGARQGPRGPEYFFTYAREGRIGGLPGDVITATDDRGTSSSTVVPPRQ